MSGFFHFEEIMNYYPANLSVYQCIKNDLDKIVPFVGAGLSAPFYPLWSKALEKLTEKIFYADADKKKNIENLIMAAIHGYWKQHRHLRIILEKMR